MAVQRTQRGTTATEAARATAEYAKYAEAGGEPLSISFLRISRIPPFNPCDDPAAVQIFAAREQIGLWQCKERSAAQPQPKRQERPRNTRNTRKQAGNPFPFLFRVFRVFRG